MARVTPMGALLRGIAAGAVGALAQTLFFKASAKVAPSTPKDVFEAPEDAQRSEMSTETVARRLVEHLAHRGPLTPDAKKRAATAVHIGFGAGWGALYGLAVESIPALRGPLGGIAYGTVVWGVGDELVLPALKLSAWPNKYPLKLHGYALIAHFAYGLAMWGSYEMMQQSLWAGVGAGLWALGMRRRTSKVLPSRLRPAAGTVVGSIAAVRARRPLHLLRAMAEVARA